MNKPRLFIGSSVEGKEIADTIQLGLDRDAEVTVWHQGVFGLSHGSLESLVSTSREFDFAALVLAPDDVSAKRGKSANSSRDNVIFELGLFMGALGRERTFMVYCRDHSLELPSDLAGVTPATFAERSDRNLQTALGPVCTQIRQAFKTSGLAIHGSHSGRAADSSLMLQGDAYYTTDGDGPFCTTCLDANDKNIRLKEEMADFQMITGHKWVCPVCDSPHKGTA